MSKVFYGISLDEKLDVTIPAVENCINNPDRGSSTR